MPIGGRNPRPGPGRAGVPATLAHLEQFSDPGYSGDTAASPCGCSSTPQYRFERLTSRYQQANGMARPVATLPAPPQGSMYVLERITVVLAPIGSGTPTTGPVLVIAGDLDGANVADIVNPGTALASVSSDAQPIRLPAATPLNIVWMGGESDATFAASVQIRVEDA